MTEKDLDAIATKDKEEAAKKLLKELKLGERS